MLARYTLVMRNDLMLICDIFMSCVLVHINLLPRFTPMYYEPFVIISCCVHLTLSDAGW